MCFCVFVCMCLFVFSITLLFNCSRFIDPNSSFCTTDEDIHSSFFKRVRSPRLSTSNDKRIATVPAT